MVSLFQRKCKLRLLIFHGLLPCIWFYVSSNKSRLYIRCYMAFHWHMIMPEGVVFVVMSNLRSTHLTMLFVKDWMCFLSKTENIENWLQCRAFSSSSPDISSVNLRRNINEDQATVSDADQTAAFFFCFGCPNTTWNLLHSGGWIKYNLSSSHDYILVLWVGVVNIVFDRTSTFKDL